MAGRERRSQASKFLLVTSSFLRHICSSVLSSSSLAANGLHMQEGETLWLHKRKAIPLSIRLQWYIILSRQDKIELQPVLHQTILPSCTCPAQRFPLVPDILVQLRSTIVEVLLQTRFKQLQFPESTTRAWQVRMASSVVHYCVNLSSSSHIPLFLAPQVPLAGTTFKLRIYLLWLNNSITTTYNSESFMEPMIW